MTVKSKTEPRYVKRKINPEKWTPVAKHLIWRCCYCDLAHRVMFKVDKNKDIWVKEWK